MSSGYDALWRQTLDSRLQLSGIWDAVNNNASQLLSVFYTDWGAARNNGDLLGLTEYVGGPGPSSGLTVYNQTFTYDGVNRLQTASDDGGWSRNFAYDQYGSGWVTANNGVPRAGNTPTSNVYNANNRISGASYDAGGNQLAVNGDTLAYDAENRQVAATDPPALGGATETCAYDGGGPRVLKSGPGGSTIYAYDGFGHLAAEYSTAAVTLSCQTCYLSSDHLGDVRMVTDQNANVVARHDYLPFGEEIAANYAGRTSNLHFGASDNVSQKFTGKERDSETGLD